MIDNAKGYFLELESMRWFYDHYAGSPADFDEWRFSPLRAAGRLRRRAGRRHHRRVRPPARPGRVVRAALAGCGRADRGRARRGTHPRILRHARVHAAGPATHGTCRCGRCVRRWTSPDAAAPTGASRVRRGERGRASGACRREPATAAQGFGMLMLLAGEPEPVFAVEDRDADGVPVRIYRPSPDADLPVVVYLHGGGWTIGTVEQYDPVMRQVANAANAIVVAVEYRLAPEHPFPASLDDCWHALEWTAKNASDVRRRRAAPRGDGRQRGRQPLGGVCPAGARRGWPRARAAGARLSRHRLRLRRRRRTGRTATDTC